MHFGLGQGTANEVRQFEALGTSIGLSLQDYYFHCFSPIPDKRGERSAIVSKHLDQPQMHLEGLIEKQKETKSVEDDVKALVKLGVYLHCQQDSWSHSGYGDHAFGHVLDDALGRSPDETPRYLSITRQALNETVTKTFLTFYAVSQDRASASEIDQLISGLTEEASAVDKSIPVPGRTLCNKEITEYWLAKTVKAHPSLYGSQEPKLSTDTIGPVVSASVPSNRSPRITRANLSWLQGTRGLLADDADKNDPNHTFAGWPSIA
jgi:hypothetical protein